MTDLGNSLGPTAAWSPAIAAAARACAPSCCRWGPTTIDLCLRPACANDGLRGKPATKPGTLLCNSIQVRKAGMRSKPNLGLYNVLYESNCVVKVFPGLWLTRALRDLSTGPRKVFRCLEQTPSCVVAGLTGNGNDHVKNGPRVLL